MGLHAQIRRFIRTHITTVHDESDPEVALEHTVATIAEQLSSARAEVDHCLAMEHRSAAEVADEERQAQRWLECARQALRHGDEEVAREALKRQYLANRHVEQRRRIWWQLREDTARLQALLDVLESKCADLEHQREVLVMRRQLAQARRKLLACVYGGHGHARVEIVEGEILAEEYAVDAYQEIVGDQLLQRIDALDTQPPTLQIEQALTALRSELETPAPFQSHE